MKGQREIEYPGELIEAFGPPGLGETLKRRARRRKRLREGGSDTLRRTIRQNVTDPPPDGGGEADQRPRRALAVFHVAELSGPALSLESRLRWLAETAHLDVIVPGDGATADLYRQFATVHTLPYEALTLPKSPLSMLSLGRRTRQDVANFKAKLRELDPELVVVSSATLPAVQIAARREGIPVALEASELLTSGRAAPRRAAGRALIRAAGRRADVVFACSDAVAAEYAGVAAPVLTSYPPIADRYAGGDGPAFRREHGIPGDAQLVLAAGSITERRGHDVLIEAMSIVNRSRGSRPAFLAIAGEPFPRPQDRAFQRRLETLAEKAGETVRLTGFDSDLTGAYAAADVVVNPRRDPEAFGRVPCEALVAGCAVVAARTGAVAEVLHDGETALLVPPGDAAATAAAIETLLGDPALAARMAARGRADVLERFSDEAAITVFSRGLALVAAH
jgi:glycosyltransferase involved in cell wall biosynthesis